MFLVSFYIIFERFRVHSKRFWRWLHFIKFFLRSFMEADIMVGVCLILRKCYFRMKSFHYPVNFFRKQIWRLYKMFWPIPPVFVLRISYKKVTLLQSNLLYFSLIVTAQLIQYLLSGYNTEITKVNKWIHWQIISFLISWILNSYPFLFNEIFISTLN